MTTVPAMSGIVHCRERECHPKKGLSAMQYLIVPEGVVAQTAEVAEVSAAAPRGAPPVQREIRSICCECGRRLQYLTVYFFASRQAEKAFLNSVICAAEVLAATCDCCAAC
jgi:hypothetical protein